MNNWIYTKMIPSLNIEELGCSTQVDTIFGIYDSESKKNIENIRRNEYLPENSKFPELILYPKAKYTDNIHHVIFGFDYLLFSPRAFNCFSVLKIGEHQNFRCFVHHINNVLEYKVLYLVQDRTDEIVDWDYSVFTYWKPFGHVELDLVKINSQQDYIDKLIELSKLELSGREKVMIRLKKLQLLPVSETSFDLIKLGIPLLGYYVSTRFIELIHQNNLTGFAFEQIDEMNKRKDNIQPYEQL